MSDTAKPFAFSQLIPGLDFLNSFTGTTTGGTVPGLPALSNWVAPTLSVEELEKRVNELKTVQYWLEQNVHALKATIQALEVQKMTLSALRGMNVRMEDLANAFTRSAASMAAAPEPAPAAESTEAPPATTESQAQDASASGADKTSIDVPGVVDPLQWWNALTQQFQQIASNALQDAAQLKMPGASPDKPPHPPAKSKPAAARKTSKTARKAPAKKTAGAKTPRSRVN